MYSQVLTFQLQEDTKKEFESILEKWRNEIGLKIPGCRELIINYETEGLDRCNIVVLFDNEEALAEFNESLPNLELFDQSKPLLSGNVQYYTGTAERHLLE